MGKARRKSYVIAGGSRESGRPTDSEVKRGPPSPSLLRLRRAASSGTPPRPPPLVYSSPGNHSPEEPIRAPRPPAAARAPAEGSRGAGSAPLHPPAGGRLRGGGPGGGGGAGLGSIRTEGAAAGRLTPCRCPGAAVTAPLLLGAAHVKHLPL